jgi:hypothetical protein
MKKKKSQSTDDDVQKKMDSKYRMYVKMGTRVKASQNCSDRVREARNARGLFVFILAVPLCKRKIRCQLERRVGETYYVEHIVTP